MPEASSRDLVPPGDRGGGFHPADAILAAGRIVGESLGLPDDLVSSVLGEQSRRAGRPAPEPASFRTLGPQLARPAALVVLVYASSALTRGQIATATAVAGSIARSAGFTDHEAALVLQLTVGVAQGMAPLQARQALESYFDPDETIRQLVARAAQRIEIRRDRSSVAHIPPSAYEHPFDRAALAAVRSTTGIELGLRKLSEYGVEKINEIENYANRIRVGPTQFPALHDLFCEAVDLLGMPTRPELFVEISRPGARTLGVERPQIVISSSLPSLCTRSELLFLFGHELGHIRSGHSPFQMLRTFLPALREFAGQMTLGLGTLIGTGIEALLFDWYRKSELTCDRCGLLVCQDSDAAFSVLMKLAGAPASYYHQLNLDAFMEQTRAYDDLDRSALSRVYKIASLVTTQTDHPWLALRARELARWIHAGDYGRLVHPAPTRVPTCRGCGAPITHGDRFCVRCGASAG